MDSRPRLELTIHALAAGGDGIARDPQGRVVFVPLTAPGDRVRVRLDRAGRRHARASLESVLAPGETRIPPRCPHFGICGGCRWQHLRYEVQLEAKTSFVREALRRIGHLEPPSEIPVHPSPPWGYRSRARLLVQGGSVGYRRFQSHEVCATRVCPILAPALENALQELAAEPAAADGEWEIALGAGGRVRATAPGAPPDLREKSQLRVGNDWLTVSPGVFQQANAPLGGILAARVHELSGRAQRVLELHAGAGFFSLGLARRHQTLLAVERNRMAAQDLVSNLAAANLDPIRVLVCSAEEALGSSAVSDLRPQTVVLDPPRMGLDRGATASLARLGAERIVYVSCDPATLARDLGGLVSRGYCLEQLEVFDLFPQTPHVESVAVLARNS